MWWRRSRSSFERYEGGVLRSFGRIGASPAPAVGSAHGSCCPVGRGRDLGEVIGEFVPPTSLGSWKIFSLVNKPAAV